MDRHVEIFYRRASDDEPGGKFHEVIALHKAPDLTWEDISCRVPELPQGWFELAQLPLPDRIDFCRDYWLSQFPYHAGLCEFLYRFFASLDDLGIFITQQKWGDPFHIEMIYSLAGDSGYYRGFLPANPESISYLKEAWPSTIFPKDYLAFLKIHDGFYKTTDCSGITQSKKMRQEYQGFQVLIEGEPIISTSKGKSVNPKSLIPFYKSFEMPYYQCFWEEWYPEEEMGNVYYSHADKTISNVDCSDSSFESMAFPTFTDWLIFYLERVE